MTVPSAAEAARLGEALSADPVASANNAPKLLACLQEPLHEPAARAAIQALKLFFAAAHDEGRLAPATAAAAAAGDGGGSAAKRARLDGAGAEQRQGDEADPAAAFAAWLGRQYAAFVGQLLHLLRTCPSGSLQAAALGALMECARHEAGPAAFSARLYARALTALLTSATVQPELLALLVQRYLPCADVRYATLRVIARLAQQHAVRAGSAGAGSGGGGAELSDDDDGDGSDDGDGDAGSDSGSEEGADADGDLQGEQQQQQQLRRRQRQRRQRRGASDLSRAMFDVLTHVPPRAALGDLGLPPAPAKAPAGGGSSSSSKEEQQQKQQQQRQQQPPPEPARSWCGALEAGLVRAAADAGASAKARRKRKAQEEQQQQLERAAAASRRAAWAQPRAQARAYGAAWLSFLRTDLPADTYRRVLVRLHSDVLPALPNPLLLSDFLSHALGRGGFEGMLALNALFALVTRHGLEYPRFYEALYGLLTPGALLHKQRARFFALADVFLASGMVPAYSAAAFAKRLARLALGAPPAGAMLCLAFVHNVVRRHPACMVLLHRPPPPRAKKQHASGDDDDDDDDDGDDDDDAAVAAAAGGRGTPDPYNAAEPDPAKSRAVESSLWELAALRNHYDARVAAMAGALAGKDLSDRVRTSELDIGPLLPASYASLLAEELGRKLRRAVPVAFYATPPSGLFDPRQLQGDFPGWELDGGGGHDGGGGDGDAAAA